MCFSLSSFTLLPSKQVVDYTDDILAQNHNGYRKLITISWLWFKLEKMVY